MTTVSQSSPKPQADPAGLSFEQALAQVEAIIERIESGAIGLEASVSEYERGVGLLRRCQDILAKAEQRVEILSKQGPVPMNGGRASAPAVGGGNVASSADADDLNSEESDTPF